MLTAFNIRVSFVVLRFKGKGKVHPEKGHEGAEGE
jgi:hypothetical protein